MIEHRKRAWVEALRSGQYKQGDEFLCHSGNYCCIGVMSELLADVGLMDREVWHSGKVTYDGESEMPNAHFWELLGTDPEIEDEILIEYKLPEGGTNALNEHLSSLNDSGNFTFEQIADLIEYFM